MKVKDAIEILLKLNPESNIKYLYDGGARANADLIYESKSGNIVVSAYNESCTDNEDRPLDAPNEEEEEYYYTKPIN